MIQIKSQNFAKIYVNEYWIYSKLGFSFFHKFHGKHVFTLYASLTSDKRGNGAFFLIPEPNLGNDECRFLVRCQQIVIRNEFRFPRFGRYKKSINLVKINIRLKSMNIWWDSLFLCWNMSLYCEAGNACRHITECWMDENQCWGTYGKSIGGSYMNETWNLLLYQKWYIIHLLHIYWL